MVSQLTIHFTKESYRDIFFDWLGTSTAKDDLAGYFSEHLYEGSATVLAAIVEQDGSKNKVGFLPLKAEAIEANDPSLENAFVSMAKAVKQTS